MTTTSNKVARWAALAEEKAQAAGLDPRAWAPLMLAIISLESGGDPAARHAGSNAIGLGQQIAWVDGEPWRQQPYVHPRGKILSFPITWSPDDQLAAMAGLFAHYSKKTGGHRASTWAAYASGPGNLAKLVKGQDVPPVVTRHIEVYAPKLMAAHDAYSRWYSGWIASGRPTAHDAVRSGDGKDYAVELALDSGVHLGPALINPFDGTLRYGGITRTIGPRSSTAGVSPTGLAAAPATSNVLWGVLAAVASLGLWWLWRAA